MPRIEIRREEPPELRARLKSELLPNAPARSSGTAGTPAGPEKIVKFDILYSLISSKILTQTINVRYLEQDTSCYGILVFGQMTLFNHIR